MGAVEVQMGGPGGAGVSCQGGGLGVGGGGQGA